MTKRVRDKIYSLFYRKKTLAHSPLVSVIVPLYNYERYVIEAIDSILEQTYTNWELIIVDDCSTDNSFNIVDNYISNIKISQNIILIQNEQNKGSSATRNTGIKQSNGEYILCLDADDYVSKFFLEEYVKAIIKENADIVYCNAQFFQDSKHKWKAALPTDYSDKILYCNYIIGCSMFLRKAWEDVGGYNEQQKAYLDWDFWIKYNLAGYKKAVRVNKYLWYYRKHGASISDVVSNKDKELKAQIILNHKEVYDNLYIRWAEDILSNNPKTTETISTKYGMPLLNDLQEYYNAI
jgi:glycosyltransferase involved in cell wall biosynthesis